MSARDDYPVLEGPTARSAQRRDMCDEIDRLRDEADGYAAVFGEVAKVYDHITDGLISKPETDSVHVIAEHDNIVMRRIDEALAEDDTHEILRRHVQDWGACDHPDTCACSHAAALRMVGEI